MKLLFENWRRFIQEDCEVEDVLPVAHHAHYGQKRRSGSPYLTHPQAVADFAQEYGYSDLISSVAMLHDTLEDYEDVEEMSTYITNECPEALSIVQELTHEKGVDYTEYVLSLGEDALIVKLLDMKRVLGALLLLTSCQPNVIYSDFSMDFFFDKWWALGDNDFFEEGTCFLLDNENKEIWVHYPDWSPYEGQVEGEWSIEDDHILLEDIYGYDISIWAYGQCDDYSIVASSGVIVQESKLYKCEF
jgi:hypothetical protein